MQDPHKNGYKKKTPQSGDWEAERKKEPDVTGIGYE